MKIDKLTLELTEEEINVLVAMTEPEQPRKYWDSVQGKNSISTVDSLHDKLNKIKKLML